MSYEQFLTLYSAHHNAAGFLMAQVQAGIRAAKDALRKKLKQALASLTEQEKLDQSKHLVRMVESFFPPPIADAQCCLLHSCSPVRSTGQARGCPSTSA